MRQQPDPFSPCLTQSQVTTDRSAPGVLCCVEWSGKGGGAWCALGCVLLGNLFLGAVWVWLLWVSETPWETLWVRLKD